MKAFTGTLDTWLPTATGRLFADLLTITLSGGSVLRYHSSDVLTITYGGNTYTRGPRFGTTGVKSKVGVQNDEMSLTLFVDANDLVSGVPWLTFVTGGGLDGSTFQVDRVISKNTDFAAASQVGGYTRFLGRFAGTSDLGGTEVIIAISSRLELLQANVPTEVYQTGCRFRVYDAGCGLTRATFSSSGTVSTGATTSAMNTNLTQADGYFDLGVVTFTSGVNNGLTRTIKTFLHASGAITFVNPLPAAPANTDTFTIVPGCDGLLATCTSKFSNSLRFGGEPFIPDPVMAV